MARLRNALDLSRERRLASLASKDVERSIAGTWAAAEVEMNPDKKGALLEDALSDLFRTISGFEQVQKNRENDIEEIDILVRNASTDERWRKAGSYILIECKNWSKPVGRAEGDAFVAKMKRRHGRCTLGFFIAVNGVTAPFQEMVRHLDGMLVVVLTAADVDTLVAANGHRPALLQEFHDRAVV